MAFANIAAVAAGVITAGAGIYGANKAAGAQKDAAKGAKKLAKEQYEYQNKLQQELFRANRANIGQAYDSTQGVNQSNRDTIINAARNLQTSGTRNATRTFNQNMNRLQRAQTRSLGAIGQDRRDNISDLRGASNATSRELRDTRNTNNAIFRDTRSQGMTDVYGTQRTNNDLFRTSRTQGLADVSGTQRTNNTMFRSLRDATIGDIGGTQRANNQMFRNVRDATIGDISGTQRTNNQMFRNVRDASIGDISGTQRANNEIFRGVRDSTMLDVNRAERANIAGIEGARDQAIGYQQPYYDTGTNALSAAAYNLGLGERPTGYTGPELSAATQFQLAQGRDTVEGGAAGAGGLYSGNTAAALEELRAGLVSEDYNRQQQQLLGLGAQGLVAGTNMGQFATGAANDIAGQRQWGTGSRTDARDTFAGNTAANNMWGADSRVGVRDTFAGNTANNNVWGADSRTDARNNFSDDTAANNVWGTGSRTDARNFFGTNTAANNVWGADARTGIRDTFTGQSAANNVWGADTRNDLRDTFASNTANQNNLTTGALADSRAYYTGAVNDARNYGTAASNDVLANYTGQMVGQNDNLFARQYGIDQDMFGSYADAQNNYASQGINNTNSWLTNLMNARGQRANLSGQASENYTNTAVAARLARGEAESEGWLNSTNAIMGGAQNALSLYYMNRNQPEVYQNNYQGDAYGPMHRPW